MGSTAKNIFMRRQPGYVKELRLKGKNLRAQLKLQAAEIEKLQAVISQWEQWAADYKLATEESYAEADVARENLANVEQLLWKIVRLIEFGDRGASVALMQIRQLVEEYEQQR